MKRRRLKRNSTVLWILFLLAIAYGVAQHFLRTLTGMYLLDGSSGVLLGLYICSHPAANSIDLLFFHRDALEQAVSEWSGIGWLVLNVLVMLAGWLVIWIGTLKFASRGA
jgi:hypothetical protein